MKRIFIAAIIVAIIPSCRSKAKDSGFYRDVTTTAEIESLYLPGGPEATKTIEFLSEDEAVGKIVAVYPASLETSDRKWPVINIGNPSNTDAYGMMDMLLHLASWGYVVIDNMDRQTGTGASVSRTLDVFLDLAGDEDNVFYGKVDIGRIAVAGYSQGACAVVLAATRFPNSRLYKAVYLCSCPQPQLANNFNWGEYRFSEFRAPVLIFAGTGEWDSKIIAPFEVFKSTFDDIPEGIPAVQARRCGKDHEQMGGEGDPYMTAWFEYWLKGDRKAGAAFMGEHPEILENSRWQDARIKDMNL